MPVGFRRNHHQRDEAALDLRGERARLSLEPHRARPLRRAPVPGAHGRHARLLHLVFRRPAHRRRRRSRGAAGSRLLHPRAGGRQDFAAVERRRRGQEWPDLSRRPLHWARHPGVRPMKKLLLALLLVPLIAFAAYPEKPVALIVAYPPGGGTDLVARAIAPYLEKYLGGGARIVIVNRAG